MSFIAPKFVHVRMFKDTTAEKLRLFPTDVEQIMLESKNRSYIIEISDFSTVSYTGPVLHPEKTKYRSITYRSSRTKVSNV